MWHNTASKVTADSPPILPQKVLQFSFEIINTKILHTKIP